MSLEYDGKLIKNAKYLRKNPTRQENHLWYDFLNKYKVRFQRQKVIKGYIADFYCHKARLVIEIDGLGHYFNLSIEKDKKRTEELEKLGLKVLRFTNSDIDRNFKNVCEEINKTVDERYSLSQLR